MKLADYLLVKSLQKVSDRELNSKPGTVILDISAEANDFLDQLLVLNHRRHVIYLDETKKERYVKEEHRIWTEPTKILADSYDTLAVCVANVDSAYQGVDYFVASLRRDPRFSDEEGIIQSGERLASSFLEHVFKSQLYTRNGYFPYQYSRLLANDPVLSLIK